MKRYMCPFLFLSWRKSWGVCVVVFFLQLFATFEAVARDAARTKEFDIGKLGQVDPACM